MSALENVLVFLLIMAAFALIGWVAWKFGGMKKK